MSAQAVAPVDLWRVYFEDAEEARDLMNSGDRAGAKARLDDARDQCFAKLARNQRDYVATSVLATYYFSMVAYGLGSSKRQDALAELSYELRALEMAPDRQERVIWLSQIGGTYSMLGDKKKAAEYLARADKLDPDGSLVIRSRPGKH